MIADLTVHWPGRTLAMREPTLAQAHTVAKARLAARPAVISIRTIAAITAALATIARKLVARGVTVEPVPPIGLVARLGGRSAGAEWQVSHPVPGAAANANARARARAA